MSNNISFIIPITPESLLKKSDNETKYSIVQYTDITHLSEKEIHKQLDLIYSKIDGNSSRITESDQFDMLFSCLHKYSSLTTSCKSSIIVILENGIKGLASKLNKILQQENDNYRKSSNLYKNALKMYLYLLRWFISEEEKKNLENNTGRGKKKKNLSDCKWSSERQKESTLSSLVALLDNDLLKLWNNDSPEEDFLNLFTKICTDLLVVPLNTKSKSVKRCILAILGLLVHRYKQCINISSAMMEALFKYEHIITPVAELLQLLVTDYGNNEIVGDFMREIGRMDPGSNRADASGAKNIASFIVTISELMPTSVLPFVSLIIPHLANDSYSLRNGIIQALGHLICNGFSELDEKEDNMKHRDQFLDILEERFLDTTSYTRSKVIQTWIFLVKQKVVPLKILPKITDAALGRLEDKATQVRKYAIQLLHTLLKHNPFASDLRLSEFTKKYEEAVELLKQKSEKISQKVKASQSNNEQSLSQIDNTPEKNNNEEDSENEDNNNNMDEDDNIDEDEGEINFEDDEDNTDREKTEEEKKLEKVIQYYSDAIQFITRIHKGMPIVSKLLGSKVNADVLESIKFFVTANDFKIENASEGIKNMLVLIWSKEVATKEAVIEAYKKLYIIPPPSLPDQPKLIDIYIANNFVKLVLGASTTEITSLEELISNLIEKHIFPISTIQCLWDFFAMRVPNVTPKQSKGALIILSMAANSDPEIVRSKISILVSNGLGPRWKDDEDLARYACIALQKLVQQSKIVISKEQPTRFNPNHNLFQKLSSIIIEDSNNHSKWFPAAEQAINSIYCLAEQPDSLCTPIIKQLAKRLLSGEISKDTNEPTGETNNIILSKFLFVIGHIALKHMQYLEEIQNELTRRKNISGNSNKSKNNTGESLEDELGINAGVDDTDEYIQNITQNEIVLKNLLGSFSPLLVAVCSNENNQFNDHMVRSAAVIALCKYMCVSSEFCEKHLRLIFTLLERAPESWIRSDVIIALGDLASRFPNQVDAWTPKLYARLRDNDAGVRKNTLMVLSHLILNEMVRVKGQISEIALCIEDNNAQISDLAKLFFNELNNKGNCLYSIYNILPDMVSNLSVSSVSSDTFRSIMKYLFAFIEKERETETLIERLCQKRMRICTDATQLADIAYCLSLLNYSERCVRKIAENFKCYQAALVHDNVYNYFTIIIQKAKKACKADNKAEIEELEQKINSEHDGEDQDNIDPMDEDSTTDKTISTKKKSIRRSSRKQTPKRKKVTKSPSRSSKRQKKKPLRIEYSDEEEEDDEIMFDDDSE